MFWIIFATVGWTTLVVSWGLTILSTRSMSKAQNKILKRGICPACGAPLYSLRQRLSGKKPIGFRKNDDE